MDLILIRCNTCDKGGPDGGRFVGTPGAACGRQNYTSLGLFKCPGTMVAVEETPDDGPGALSEGDCNGDTTGRTTNRVA